MNVGPAPLPFVDGRSLPSQKRTVNGRSGSAVASWSLSGPVRAKGTPGSLRGDGTGVPVAPDRRGDDRVVLEVNAQHGVLAREAQRLGGGALVLVAGAACVEEALGLLRRPPVQPLAAPAARVGAGGRGGEADSEVVGDGGARADQLGHVA